jgi:sulfide:quinone oxidoreductase
MTVSNPRSQNEQRLPRIVIVGGGVAALETLLGLRKLAAGLVDIQLLSPSKEFVYTPLTVREPFEFPETPRFDLGAIVSEQRAEHVVDTLTGVDQEQRVLHTRGDRVLPYDAAVIAIGAKTRPAVPGALTFRGEQDRDDLVRLLRELERGEIHDLAFVVPSGVVWALPLYELALMTSEWLAERKLLDVNISLITPEQAPLSLFGRKASQRVSALLDRRGIALRAGWHVSARDQDSLVLVPRATVRAERIVAAPALSGWQISGLAHTPEGFLRTNGHGLVQETSNIYAAGDVTSFPIKQGGIATQQADSIVTTIAARFGADDVTPRPFRPVLRGLLLSEDGPTYLRAEIGGGSGDSFEVSTAPLWWPGAKIAGRYLAPYLATREAKGSGHSAQSRDRSLRTAV